MSTLAALTNHQTRLAARPNGMPKRSDWQFTSEPVGGHDAHAIVLPARLIRGM